MRWVCPPRGRVKQCHQFILVHSCTLSVPYRSRGIARRRGRHSTYPHLRCPACDLHIHGYGAVGRTRMTQTSSRPLCMPGACGGVRCGRQGDADGMHESRCRWYLLLRDTLGTWAPLPSPVEEAILKTTDGGSSALGGAMGTKALESRFWTCRLSR
jgi:hypothetical protein